MNLDRIIAVRNDKTVFYNGECCFKVFNDSYTAADVLSEALNQSLAANAGVRTSKIFEVTTVDGKWTIVFEYISGKTLEQLICVNPDKLDYYLEQFVNLQIEMQQKTCMRLKKLSDTIKEHINKTDISVKNKIALFEKLNSLPEDNKICHGDFIPSNIIISNDNTPYIIDWSHATRGNALADVATTYILLKMNNSVESAEIYLNLYCKSSGAKCDDVLKWVPIVAASKLVVSNLRERKFLNSCIQL